MELHGGRSGVDKIKENQSIGNLNAYPQPSYVGPFTGALTY